VAFAFFFDKLWKYAKYIYTGSSILKNLGWCKNCGEHYSIDSLC